MNEIEATKPGETQTPQNPLARQTTYRFLASDIDHAVTGRLNNEGQRAKIKGFRPGRVPMRVLKQHYGKQTLHDTLMEKAVDSFQNESQKADWRPASHPVIVPNMIASDDDYQVECHYEVFPDIQPPNFENKELKRPALTVGDFEVEQMIEKLRRDSGVYETVNRPAQEADGVIVDFNALLGDEVLEEGKERRWVVNSPMMRKEINDRLIGINADDKMTVDISYSDDHGEEKLRGKTVQMKVHVKQVMELKKPDLDEAFFTRFGVQDGDISAFRKLVREHLSREVSERLRTTLHQRALNLLVAATPRFDLPQAMLRAEIKSLFLQTHEEYKKMEMATSQINVERLLPEAVRRVSLGLALAAWQNRENIAIEDDAVNQRLEELSQGYESPKEFAAGVRKDERQMQGLRLSLLEERVVSWVCQKIGSGEEQLTLSQLMGEDFGDNSQPTEIMADDHATTEK